jgi:hypothetical protein
MNFVVALTRLPLYRKRKGLRRLLVRQAVTALLRVRLCFSSEPTSARPPSTTMTSSTSSCSAVLLDWCGNAVHQRTRLGAYVFTDKLACDIDLHPPVGRFRVRSEVPYIGAKEIGRLLNVLFDLPSLHGFRLVPKH